MGNRKLSIILFSGDFDRAIAAFTLATGGACHLE
jgi:peroxiredoxin family protein